MNINAVSIGDMFGNWEVIDTPFYKYVGKTKIRKRPYVKCRCICGLEKEVRLEDMLNGKSTKCKECNKSEKSCVNEYIKVNENEAILRVFSVKEKKHYDFIFDSRYIQEVKKRYWGIRKSGDLIYLRSSKRQKESERESLHRLLYSLEYCVDIIGEKNIIDHINRNTFDNRITNLKLVTPLENAQNSSIRKDNTSGVKGVSWDKNANKWRAYISSNRQKINLGSYEDFQKAVNARKEAEKKYHKYNESIKEEREVR